MHITVYRADGCVHIGSPSDLQSVLPDSPFEKGQLAPIRFHDEWQARSFLRKYFRDDFEIGRLRAVLASEVQDLSRKSDEDVLSAAALRLAGGAWRVVGGVDPRMPAPTETRGQAQSARRDAPLRSGATPRPPPHGRSRPAPRAPGARIKEPAYTPPAAPDWSGSAADQLAQAEALEQAARDGAPFCEVCEALRKADTESGHG